MAAGDLALNILLTANATQATGAIGLLSGSLVSLASTGFKSIANAAGNISFGLRNMETEGTIGMDALKQGASGAAMGFAALGAVAGVVVAGAMVAIGTKAVQMAGNFQESTTTLVTGAGEAESAVRDKFGHIVGGIDMVRQGLLTMAVDTATPVKSLVDGMFMVESAGYHGAAGLDVMRAAAEGAKVGNADLGVTANALTTVLTDYHMRGDQATQAMNGLIATMKSGKMHLQELAGSMGSVLPLASSLGIAFPQVGGAIATMTNAGMSAQRASMNLANAIRSLAAPGATAKKTLKDVGISTDQLNDTLTHKGLQQALQMIEDHVGQKFPAGSSSWTAAMKSIMGGATGLNVALMLGGKNMGTYKDNIASITGAMSPAQRAVLGWSAVQRDFNFRVAQAKEVIETLMIKIGTALLPVVTQLASQLIPVMTQFSDWVTKSHLLENAIAFIVPLIQQMISTISTMLPPVIGAFLAFLNVLGQVMTWIVHNQTAMQAFKIVAIAIGAVLVTIVAAGLALVVIGMVTMGIVIGALVGIIMGIVWVFRNWGAIGAWFQGIWAAVIAWLRSAWTAVAAFFVALWQGLVSRSVAAWQGLISGIQGAVNAGVAWLRSIWQQAVTVVVGWFLWLYNHNYYFKNLVDFINNVVRAGLAWLTSTWASFVAWLAGVWHGIQATASSVWSAITGAIRTAVSAAQAFLSGAWAAISSFLQSTWSRFASFAQSAWQAVSSVFASIWGTYIVGPLSSLASSLSGWFSNLAATAVSWGTNLIQGFINGITSMAGAVGGAVQNIIGTVGGFLGFHSPAKQGEGRYIEQWGHNMVKGFVKGMVTAQPLLNAQLSQMISAPNSLAYSGTRGNNNAFALSGSNHTIVVQMQPADIYLDNKKVGESVMSYAGRQVRIQGGYRNG